jgi:hypothetical protein
MAERKKIRKAPLPSVEDQILGVEPKIEVKTTINYEAEEILYKVTNLKVETSSPSTFNGTKIEAFIGGSNEKARDELINGAKSVITFDGDGNEAYKIEVIK